MLAASLNFAGVHDLDETALSVNMAAFASESPPPLPRPEPPIDQAPAAEEGAEVGVKRRAICSGEDIREIRSVVPERISAPWADSQILHNTPHLSCLP